MRAEPRSLLDTVWDRSAVHRPLFHANLGDWDQQGRPVPVLAEALPQLHTDTWRVLPDGRMETTYRLRPNLRWHDGTPFTAADVALSHQVATARVSWGLDQPAALLRVLEEVVPVDDRTVVMRWKALYPEAAAPDLFLAARHLVEPALLAGDGDGFGNLPYWSTEFVGLGPYRLERWERGAFIAGQAVPDYALGRARIERIRLTWNNDPTVTLTRMIAGDADIVLDGAIRFDQVRVLREQWQGQGVALLSPTSLRYLQVQARPDYADPRSLLDVRVRRALMHAIDRAALAEAMLDDRSMVADTVPPPSVPYFGALERSITKYPFDARRADQLLSEAGWTKGADSIYGHSREGRFRLDVRGVAGGQEEQDTTIVAAQLRDGGIETGITLLPASARAVDDRTKGTFPGISLNDNSLQRGLGLNKWLSANIGGPETNWVGGNRMGWSNPTFDALYDRYASTLEPEAAADSLVQMMVILSEELPSIPLYYQFQVVAHTAALRGPEAFTPDSTRYANIATWQFQ
jgi:peptide/nickel transport system substrate-binding protein